MTDQHAAQAEKALDKAPAAPAQIANVTDGPPKSNQQIAADWDAAYNSHNFTAVNKELATAAQQAYQNGGTDAVSKLQKSLNDMIKAPNAGPVFIMNGDKIEVHNVQAYSDAQRAALPPSEQSKLVDLHSPSGDFHKIHEISQVTSIDKPSTQGLNLKPGQKLSADYPSEYAIATALKAGKMDHLDWMASNPEQRYLTDHLQQASGELGKIPPGVIDGVAQTGGVDKVNKFLADKGMDMRLDPVSSKTDVAMAAVLSLKGAWSGKETTMTIDGKEYPAAMISHVQTFNKNGTDVAKLYSKDGITVYAAPIGDDKLSSFQVTQRAANLTPDDSTPRGDATKVEMPKVDKNVQTELVGLKGMMATDGSQINQAKMQTKLQIDQNGFSAEQGVALAASRGLELDQPMRLDKPFIIWATADGASQPLFATSVDQKYWKDPKAPK